MDQNRCEKTEDTVFRFGKTIQTVSKRFRLLADENLAKHGITFSQLRILAFVSRNGLRGEVFQKDLEEAFGIRRSSVTEILQNMEKSGILIRTASREDARVKKLCLTEKGKALDESLRSYIHTLEEELVSGFSSEEKDAFQKTLEKVSENLDRIERKEV